MAVVETVEWGGRVWRRYPESKRRNHRVYFQCHASAGSPLWLHQEVWKAAHGEIPDGYEIHHKDDDSLNNALDNLDCIPLAEHRKRHSGRCSDKMRSHLDAVRPLAAAWHGSEAGHAWHSEHAVKVAAERRPSVRSCKVCGADFASVHAYATFCSQACRDRGRPARRKLHQRTCVGCGVVFATDRNRARFCTRPCAVRSSWAAKRAGVQPDG
jgi:hypothetical protein